ncbi:MAG: metallophosphoesterase [Alphaproteobacteria bacterium]
MITRRTFLRRTAQLAGLGVGAGAGVGGYASIIEPRFRVQVTPWTVEHASWPAATPPLKIAIITDMHVIEPWTPVSHIEHVVEMANALKPDITVLLGDFVPSWGIQQWSTHLVPVPEWTGALGRLRARFGVYAVLGNHDWWDADVRVLRKEFKAVGIPVLENQTVKIDQDGYRFWVAGLGDQIAHYLGHHRFRGADDLPGTLRPTMRDKDPVILLAHEPDIFVRVPDRVTVTLCGHTHGGQVWLPYIGSPIVPSAYGQRFIYGHIVEGGRNLVVAAGLGMTGVPVRFMVPPEIALVTVTAPGSVPIA